MTVSYGVLKDMTPDPYPPWIIDAVLTARGDHWSICRADTMYAMRYVRGDGTTHRSCWIIDPDSGQWKPIFPPSTKLTYVGRLRERGTCAMEGAA